jgi:hypothetical protein
LAHEGSIGVIVPDTWVSRAAGALGAAGVTHMVLGAGTAAADGTGEELLDAAMLALGGDDPDGENADGENADGDTPDGDDSTGARIRALPRVSVVPATTAKGLEYDRVVVVEPTRIAADEPDERTGLRRLYVVLTRAVSGLTVVHHEPLPALLATQDAGAVSVSRAFG